MALRKTIAADRGERERTAGEKLRHLIETLAAPGLHEFGDGDLDIFD
jgi:hypothetical protein